MHIRKLPTVYIGFDKKESVYYDVLRQTIINKSRSVYNIVPIVQEEVRRSGMYWRGVSLSEGHRPVDMFDGKPFSTEFSFTRFLVPFLNQGSGLALFMDCDMFVRADIGELFDTFPVSSKALGCVKHKYAPTETIKMDGQVQTVYPRKNWSSLVMWNCDHRQHREFLTVGDVNTKSGSWLHGFNWLDSVDEYVHGYNEEWNWLDGHSPAAIEAKCVHFTTGGPAYSNWTGKRQIDAKYADEWHRERLDCSIYPSTLP